MMDAVARAIASGDTTALETLLRADPTRVGQRSAKGMTPLHLAAGAGKADMVRALLRAGADPEAPDAFGHPPIGQAAWGGHRAVIELLVGRLDPGSAAAASLLILLASRGHRACVELTLARGVPVDASDGLGQTPLIYALRNGHADVATLLLERGARVDIQVGASKESPLSLAKEHKLAAVVALVQARRGSAAAPAEPEDASPTFPSLESASRRLKGARLITLAEAKKLLRGLPAFKRGKGAFRIHLWEGDHRRRGNLLLDAYEVLIVTGKLVVDGALVDSFYNEDDYSQLFVLGDLAVRAMITGSPVHVRGDLVVRDTLYANSFGLDALTVGGALRAGAIIDEGHEISCSRIEAGRIFASEGQLPTWGDTLGARKLRADVFADRALFRGGFVDAERLFRRASQGQPILAPGGAARGDRGRRAPVRA